jgi:hypothetical protein
MSFDNVLQLVREKNTDDCNETIIYGNDTYIE